MKGKIKSVLTGLLLISCLTSCNNGAGDELKGTAIFYLEGGICQNNTERVMYAYTLEDENSLTYIADPNVLQVGDIKRVGYSIEGWYQIKNGDGTYSDKRDFATDKMGKEGVTLYANWVKDVKHTYDICYLDESNTPVIVYSYSVSEGDKFKDLLSKANSRNGYTALPGFYDLEGNVWNEEFTHPGGDSDCSVKVIAKYIEGEYELVSTAKEFKKATNKGIYLLNDIDLEGQTISFTDYKGKQINGNGHTVSNFVIECDPANLFSNLEDSSSNWSYLYCGLFRQIEDSTIENINFTNCSLIVDTNYSKTTSITISPFASSVKNSTIKNVNFECNLTITSKTQNFVSNSNKEYKLVTDKFYSIVDESSKIENSTITITQIEE